MDDVRSGDQTFILAMAARRVDTEEYLAATAAARDVRLRVADQLRELTVEADRMSSRDEFGQALQRLLSLERLIGSARAKQRQASELGMPSAPHVQAEREAAALKRDAVMQCAVACAGWVAAMDFEEDYRGAAEG